MVDVAILLLRRILFRLVSFPLPVLNLLIGLVEVLLKLLSETSDFLPDVLH